MVSGKYKSAVKLMELLYKSSGISVTIPAVSYSEQWSLIK